MKMSSIIQMPAMLPTIGSTAKTAQSFAPLRCLSRLMMGLFVLLGLLSLNQQAKAQATTLAAGDLAVVGMNSANPDKFAVVLLKDINTGTVINFTDNGFTGSNTTGRTGEGFLTYTAPAAQTAGTVLTWTNGMTIAGTGWSSNNPTNFAINGSGDQLFAFQGSTANWATQSGITLLYGINFGVALNSLSGASNTLQPSTTILPAASFLNLPTSTNANGYFANGTTAVTSVTVSGSPSSLLALFVDATKWVGTTGTAATFPTYSITVNTATPTITTTGTLAAVNTTYGSPSATPTSFTVSGANMNAGILVTPPSGYEVSQTAGGASGYAATQTIGTSGTIAATTVFVRLMATSSVAGSPYSGDIVCSSTGAASQNVATVSSTVSPAALTITANDQNKVYNTVLSLGTSAFTATGLQNGETIGSVILTDGGEAANATANVGTYPITPSAATGGTFTASNYTISYVAGTLTITKANQTITFNTLPNKLSTDADFNLTATASSGLAVTYAGNNNAVATVTSGGLVDLLIAGTVDFTASQAGDANWNPAADVTRTQTVINGSLITPVITFNALAAVTYGDAPFTLGATSNSPVTITYTSSDPTVASISGNTVTILKNGTTVITASQAGDGVTYNAAVDVPQTLTVNQKALTVSGAVANNKQYDGTTAATIDITGATLNGVVGTDQVILNGTSGTFATADVGTGIAVTPAFTLSGTEATRYTVTQPALTADITLASQSISGLPATDTRTYSATPVTYQLAATASSGLAVTYTSSNPSVATVTTSGFVTITGGGTTTITASQAGNATYSAAPDALQALTVNPANQTITFATLPSKTTTDADFQLTATASSALAVTYTSSNPAVATVTTGGLVHITGPGTTNITASQAGDANFNAATDVVRVLTVTYPVIAGWDFTGVGTSTLNTLAATTFDANLITTSGASNITRGAGAAWSTGNNSFRTVGFQNNGIATTNTDYFQVTLNAVAGKAISVSSISANLAGTASFAVAPGVSNQFAYSLDGTNFTLIGSPTVTTGTPAAIPLIDVTGITALQNVPAGTTITIRYYASGQTTTGGWGFTSSAAGVNGLAIGGAVNNIAAPVITSALTANATVGTSFNYQIVAPGATSYSSSTTLPVNGLSLNTTTGVISGTPTTAGTNTINLTATNASGSDSKDLVITVAPGNQTITGISPLTITKTFGDANYSLGSTVSATSGLAVTYSSSNTAVATVDAAGAVQIVGAGTANIIASQAGDANWNAAPDVIQVLTVNKADQTITFNVLPNKLSTDADYNLVATSTSGLPVSFTGNNNAVATVTSAGLVHIVAVGTVDFTASQAGDANYNPATDVTRTQVVLNGNLITPVITFNALAPVTYGDAPFALGATSNSPVAITYTSSDPTVASISGSTVTILKNGTTVITASQAGDGVTYNAAVDVSQTLTVNQKALTVSGAIANNKVYDGTSAATIDITAATLNGVVGADQVILNGTSGTFATADVGTAIAVTPAFTLSGTEASRYTVTLPALTADITKATQTITGLPATDTRTYALTPVTYQLAVTASSGLAVTYTSSDPLVATVTTGGFVTITGAGTANITASQAGDGNYDAAADVVQALTVNKANQFITFSTPVPKVTTDADFQLTATASSALAVTYTSSNPAVATVTSSGLVHITGAGTTSITVSQPGDGNFNPATDVVRTLLVTKPIVAHWTFEAVSLSTPGATLNVSAGSAAADAGLQTAGSAFTGAHASAATIWTTGAGNGSTKGVGSDRWAVGDYWQFSASTTGYQDISLVWDQIGSNTGPGNFKVQYSTDGTNFTDFSTYATPNNAGAALSWSSTTPISTSTLNFDLSSITALNNAATVYFRLVNNNTTSVNGGTVATAGTGRLDNFKITAMPLVVTPPVITSSLTATATVGTAFSYQIVAAGATSFSSTTTLPLNGLSLNTTTGEITGTPTTAGTTTINLTATNAGGSDSKDLVITVNSGCSTTGVAVPTAVSCFGGNNGTALVTLSGAGFGTSGTYTVDGAPAGTYTTNPFTVTGLTAGNHTVVTTNGTCVSSPISFTVGGPASALVLNASVTQIAVPGGTGSVTLSATGGTAPYTFAPANPPTNNLAAGSYTYNVTDANGCTASRTVSIYLEVITVTPFVLDATAYRGAFAPAPTRQWTESWTNFDPQNTAYGTPNVMVNAADSIISNTTWTRDNVYQLNGPIYVSNNATLTIEPGTVIRGNTGNSALIVARGAKLIAEGTPCNPIVFTSNQAAGARTPGAWGGVILLGNANNNQGTNNLIEGLDNTDGRNFHGGTDDADNSGILKYVRIEYSGFVFSANNEINGLTLGSVGNGTTLDYVQVSHGDDDAFEWFGGSVNAKHLVAYKTKDDDFDSDNGYSGTVQYALGIKDPNISDVSQSEGFESDNSATGIAGQLPKTSAKFYNVTQIGAFRCASNADASGVAPTALFQHRRGARVRRNSDLKIVNSILMNNWRGLFIDDAIVAGQLTQPTSANYNEDSALFRNNIIAGDFTTIWTGTNYNGTQSLAYEDAVTRAIGTSALYGNDSVNTCSLLIDPWNANTALADFRPNIGGAGALVTNAANLSTGADITPTVDIDNALFTPNQAYDFVINIFENGGGSTNGVITVTVPMPSGWNITVPSTTSGTSDVFGGTPNENSNWTFTVIANNSVTITSKPGTIIGKNGQAVIGLRATRRATTSTGTSQSLSLTVSGGGDATPGNNSNVTGLGTSN